MVALTRVPDGELWRSFPEADRNDVLGLLGMLLERLAGPVHQVPDGVPAQGPCFLDLAGLGFLDRAGTAQEAFRVAIRPERCPDR
jgi:hypothetical protein